MKIIILITAIFFSQQAYSGCEASIVDGSHTAITEQDAVNGAWEDAKDACYPGEASKLDVRCENVSGSAGVQGENAVRCVQQATCTLCGDNLKRKYEALD